jgi:hypothetical protein
MKYREIALKGRNNPLRDGYKKNTSASAAKDATFSMILTSALGGGSLGGAFGVSGTLVGIALGVVIGVLIKIKQTDD